jgi:hypothetical protein
MSGHRSLFSNNTGATRPPRTCGATGSVIVTPGHIEESNTADKAFIKRSSESESGSHAGNALMDDDPDYVPSEAGGTDGDEDDDDDDEQPRRSFGIVVRRYTATSVGITLGEYVFFYYHCSLKFC